jgi:hypothetical protein
MNACSIKDAEFFSNESIFPSELLIISFLLNAQRLNVKEG